MKHYKPDCLSLQLTILQPGNHDKKNLPIAITKPTRWLDGRLPHFAEAFRGFSKGQMALVVVAAAFPAAASRDMSVLQHVTLISFLSLAFMASLVASRRHGQFKHSRRLKLRCARG